MAKSCIEAWESRQRERRISTEMNTNDNLQTADFDELDQIRYPVYFRQLG
jgi:hypothetical protein